MNISPPNLRPNTLRAALLAAILGTSFIALRAADQKSSDPDPAKKMRLDIHSGSLVTSTGLPISLRAVNVDIDKGDGQKTHMLVHNGDAFLSNDGLTKLLQQKVPSQKITDLKVATANGKLRITGTAHKVIPIPVSVEGPVDVTSDGNLRMTVDKEKAAKLPFTKIADLLGISLKDMAGTQHPSKGIYIESNALVVDPASLWGFDVDGKITGAKVEKNGLDVHFSDKAAAKANAKKKQAEAKKK